MGKQLLKSRKFWAAIVGVLFSILSIAAPDFPISEEAASNSISVIMAYILGVALEDGLSKRESS